MKMSLFPIPTVFALCAVGAATLAQTVHTAGGAQHTGGDVGQAALAAESGAARLGGVTVSGRKPLPEPDQEQMSRISRSVRLVRAGDASAAKGEWLQAEAQYQQALSLWPYREAVYGLGQCADFNGNVTEAIVYYRKCVYSDNPAIYGTVPGDGYQENSVTRLMQYVLLLNKAGQMSEALSIYNRAANLLNYRDGRQHLAVPLPSITADLAPPQSQYLEGMARLAIGLDSSWRNVAQLEKAAQLLPDSAAAQFYLGKHLYGRSNSEAKAALERAIQLGDDRTAAAANEYLKFIH